MCACLSIISRVTGYGLPLALEVSPSGICHADPALREKHLALLLRRNLRARFFAEFTLSGDARSFPQDDSEGLRMT
jgi:hypothetical protein